MAHPKAKYDHGKVPKLAPQKRACPTSTSSPSKRVHSHDAVKKNLLLGATWSQYQEMIETTNDMIACNGPNTSKKEATCFEWAVLSRELYFRLAQTNDAQFMFMDALSLRAEWEGIASARNEYNAYSPFIGERAREMAIAQRQRSLAKKPSDVSGEQVVAQDLSATTQGDALDAPTK